MFDCVRDGVARLAIVAMVAASAPAAGDAPPPEPIPVCDADGRIVSPDRFDKWNPEPYCDDVVLPMPCGVEMALRRVVTPTSENWLDDVPVRLGDSDPDAPYSDFVRQGSIAGSLTSAENAAERYYLIGKHELTERQVAAVMLEEEPNGCATLQTASASRPHDTLSWFDVVVFSRRYSLWLLTNAVAHLPASDSGAMPFVRLPTEVEWEFAARGGAEIDTEARRSRRFPMEDAPSEYIWYSSTDSCNGKVRSVGRLRSNPLGIHDILGNVEEIVLEPYRLNRGGSMHGQSGGFITKGGSCLTELGDITTGMRREQPFYSSSGSGDFRPRATGARIVLVAPIQTSTGRIAALQSDWAALQDTRTAVRPAQDLIALSESIEEGDTRERIADAAADVTTELAERKRVETRSIQTAIVSGASHVRVFRRDDWDVKRFERVCVETPGSVACDIASATKRRRDLTRSVYVEILVQTAEDFSAEELREQVPVVVEKYASIGRAMSVFAALFVEQAVRYKDAPDGDLGAYFDEILAVPPIDEASD